MGNVKDAVAWSIVRSIQQAGYIKRLALNPGLESRSCQDVIQHHRQLETILLREEGVDLEDTQFLEWWILGLQNELVQSKVTALAPGVFEYIGEQYVFA